MRVRRRRPEQVTLVQRAHKCLAPWVRFDCQFGLPRRHRRQIRYVHAGHAVISFGLLVALSRGPSKWRPAVTVVALASTVVTVFMQYEAWTTPRRWRPIIAKTEAVLRESDRKQARTESSRNLRRQGAGL